MPFLIENYISGALCKASGVSYPRDKNEQDMKERKFLHDYSVSSTQLFLVTIINLRSLRAICEILL